MNRTPQILLSVLVLAACTDGETGEPEAAETPRQSARAPRPTAVDAATAELLRETAELHRQGKYSVGIARLEDELRRDPDRPRLHYNLGVLRASAGEYDEAIGAFEEEIGRYPAYADSYRAIAAAYTRLGRLEDSVPPFERCLREDPDDTLCAFQLGRNLSTLGLFADAEPHLQHAAELRRDAEAYAELGVLHRRLGRLDRAAETFGKALAEDPRHLATLLGYGQALTALGREEDAEALLERHRRLTALADQLETVERMRARSEPRLEVFLELARLHQERGDRPAVIAAYERALELDGGNSFAALELAELYLRDDRLDRAERCIDIALAADQRDPAPRFFLGLLKLKRGDAEAASKAFVESQELGGWPAAAYRDLAGALHLAGEPEPAARAYMEALRLDPKDARAYHGMAVLYDEQGEGANAAAAARQAVALDPAYCDAWLLLASLHLTAGDSASAEHAFRQALAAERLTLLESGGAERLLEGFTGSAEARDLLRRLIAQKQEGPR